MSEEEECSNNATSTELENKAIEQNVFEVICKDDVARNDHVDDQDNMSPTNAMCQNFETINLNDSPSVTNESRSTPKDVMELKAVKEQTQDVIKVKGIESFSTPENPVCPGSSCTDSPGLKSQDEHDDDDDDDDEEFYRETAGDERMTLIEEEYIDRITLLERRNNELEAVLLRLSSAVERLLCLDEVEHVVNEDDIEVDDEEPSCEPVCSQSEEIEVATEAKEQSDTEAECEYDSETSENCENAQVPSTDSNSVLDAPADPLDQPKADEEENEETTEENNKPDEVEQNTVAEDEDDLKTQNDLEENVEEPGNINGSSARCVSKHICLELFIEFQKKLALFAAELKGVLNCSESAIRHGRVVQEWGKNVQLMFEQLLHERKKMMNYIEERETTLMQYREQFMAEKQIQARQLQNLVDEMKKYKELMETTEEACREKAIENSYRKSIADNIVEVLFERRLDEERAVILSLARQSKISEMKLFIMHQQNCIQDLQIQNKELRAVIEGLVGPDDIDVGSSFDEQTFDTDQSGTPASVGTPERRTLTETLTKIAEQPISLVSDVLNCDRGNYLPGLSTDGDIATVQAYDIGRGTETIEKDSNVVFDPLTVDYVREHCQQAEETDRRARAAQPKTEKTDDVEKTSTITTDTGDLVPEIAEDGRETPEEDRGVLVMQDGVQALNIEPYLRKKAEEERLLATLQEASGDGVDILNRKKTEEEVPDKAEMEQKVETDSTA